MKLKAFDKKMVRTGLDIVSLEVSSSEFELNGFIPSRFTCDGLNVNPPLAIDHIPAGTSSLALIVDDPDAPIRSWVHWLAWNIPVTQHIKEDCSLKEQGMNDFRENRYCGPCPPYGTHRYFFKVYALDVRLQLPAKTTKTELERAMQGHVVGYGELVGRYKRR
jgi:Raf kinase inhibitor-like YbhB/YbcL family protein